jgi:hypothetical protein
MERRERSKRHAREVLLSSCSAYLVLGNLVSVIRIGIQLSHGLSRLSSLERVR